MKGRESCYVMPGVMYVEVGELAAFRVSRTEDQTFIPTLGMNLGIDRLGLKPGLTVYVYIYILYIYIYIYIYIFDIYVARCDV